MKSKSIKIISALLIVCGMTACDKSSFQLRDGGSDAEVTKNINVEECTLNCDDNVETLPEEPTVYPEEPTVYPEEPVVHPPVVHTDKYSCGYEKELFGSVAHITHGENSQELLWNYFQPRGTKDFQVAYYQVVVMDAQMTMFKSKYLGLKDVAYLVHPNAVGIDGQKLSSKFQFKQGNWYWYKLVALDKNYKPVHIRKFDVQFSNYNGEFNRVVGYCSGY